MRRKNKMVYAGLILLLLIGYDQFMNWRQKAYVEIAALKDSPGVGASQYPLFQEIIDGDTAGFKQLWLAQSNAEHQVSVRIEVMSYLIVTNFKNFNMYETAMNHGVKDIVVFLLEQHADPQAFVAALGQLPPQEQQSWREVAAQNKMALPAK